MKTLIGVLASRDDAVRNESLARMLEKLQETTGHQPWWNEFSFAFSGGTYDRVVTGVDDHVSPVNDDTWEWIHNTCGVLRLPEGKRHGGGILLGCLVARGTIQLLWPFFSPATSHWLHPENLALFRLSDLLNVSTFMNAGSVLEWACVSAQWSDDRHPVVWPPTITLEGTRSIVPIQETAVQRGRHAGTVFRVLPQMAYSLNQHDVFNGQDLSVIALIAHDQKKEAMRQFAIDHEHLLRENFSRILCTGTTGEIVQQAAPSLESMVHRYHSGPKGGDLEIAAEVLFGVCHVVVFFTDPLRPHPHADDIRSIFGACMRQDQVRMFSNERQARLWFRARFGD